MTQSSTNKHVGKCIHFAIQNMLTASAYLSTRHIRTLCKLPQIVVEKLCFGLFMPPKIRNVYILPGNSELPHKTWNVFYTHFA
jgi:hypothetical protein